MKILAYASLVLGLIVFLTALMSQVTVFGSAREFSRLDSPATYTLDRHLVGNGTICYVVQGRTNSAATSISCVGAP